MWCRFYCFLLLNIYYFNNYFPVRFELILAYLLASLIGSKRTLIWPGDKVTGLPWQPRDFLALWAPFGVANANLPNVY